MTQHLRIEDPKRTGLITSRTLNSRLWFINNPPLEAAILGALAKYQNKHNAVLYAFALMGNHYHTAAKHPDANRALFTRDLNAQIARLTKRFIPEIERGKLWEKRYAEQELPRNEDIEEYFFYCALQAVTSELAGHPKEYCQYNSFNDAINGIERTFTFTDWTKYNNARRCNPDVDISRYQTTYPLKFTRLPGYEHLNQQQYKAVMLKKFEERRLVLVAAHLAEGKKYMSPAELSSIRPGAYPAHSKQSTRFSGRPLVLCSCPVVRQERLAAYFSTRALHRAASIRYLAGDLTVPFPPGTYRPPLMCHKDFPPLTHTASPTL